MENGQFNNLPQFIQQFKLNDVRLGLVLQQTNKDFALQGIQLNADPTNSISFLTEVKQVLDELIRNNVSLLYNILYRIDISEQRIAIALSENKEETSFVFLKLILERELNKVIMKEKWSKSSE